MPDKNDKSKKMAGKTSDFKKISSPNISESESRNFHRFYPGYEKTEYITYGSICDFSTKEIPVITDEAERITESQSSADTISNKKISSESNEEPDEILQIDSSELFANEADNTSNVEKFIEQQELKHPKFYFALGLSIFIIAMLGFASCAYLGLNALRNYAAGYQSGEAAASAVSFFLKN